MTLEVKLAQELPQIVAYLQYYICGCPSGLLASALLLTIGGHIHPIKCPSQDQKNKEFQQESSVFQEEMELIPLCCKEEKPKGSQPIAGLQFGGLSHPFWHIMFWLLEKTKPKQPP